MKNYINLILFLILLIPFRYAQFPKSTTDITNVYIGHEDALINDFIKLEFDKKNSKISFDFVSEETNGSISGLDFKISFNPEDTDNAHFKGTALINTLDTDNFLRDGHLMWEKYFHKKKYPKIAFEEKQTEYYI